MGFLTEIIKEVKKAFDTGETNKPSSIDEMRKNVNDCNEGNSINKMRSNNSSVNNMNRVTENNVTYKSHKNSQINTSNSSIYLKDSNVVLNKFSHTPSKIFIINKIKYFIAMCIFSIAIFIIGGYYSLHLLQDPMGPEFSEDTIKVFEVLLIVLIGFLIFCLIKFFEKDVDALNLKVKRSTGVDSLYRSGMASKSDKIVDKSGYGTVFK